jgi:hypothetical protein
VLHSREGTRGVSCHLESIYAARDEGLDRTHNVPAFWETDDREEGRRPQDGAAYRHLHQT